THRWAPSTFALCTAELPTVPLAPSTRTVSSGVTFARQATASQPVTPAIPHASASPSSTPTGTSYVCPGEATACSATAAFVRNQTRRPSGAVPTASEPITYGVSGDPP